VNNKKFIRRIYMLFLIMYGIFAFFSPPNAIAAPLAGEEKTAITSQPISGSAAATPAQPEKTGKFSAPATHPTKVSGSSQQPHTAKPSGKGARYVTIDFDNVDIQVFVKFISELTGKNFIIDEKIKGKVSVISPRKIALDDVYKVFLSVLEVNGFAAVESGEVIKIVPLLTAKEKGLETRTSESVISSEDRMVTQIISLKHAGPDEMKKVLDPLISKSSVILSYPPTGTLIIADMLSNVKRLQDIIEALDVPGVGELISYVPLHYASATEMLKYMTILFQQQAGKAGVAPIKIVADERANALIISATENDTNRVKELLKLMDKEIPRGAGSIRVYYLQNAKAEELAKVLTTLPQHAKPSDGKPAAISKSVQIVADKATNSLIITADTSDYLIMEDVIRKLDMTRPMVYLESLIMEVNAAKSFKLGVEWQGGNTFSYNGRTGAYIGGVSGDGGKYNIAASLTPTVLGAPAVPALPSGLTLGLIGQAITVGGITFPNMAAFIQAYQSDTDFRILATPQIMTLDNEEAEITVGKNIPYVTRQDTTTTATINYSSYEYKDVGITLKVTPQINNEGFIRMKIDQAVTKLDTQTQDIGSGQKVLAPTTLKRTAKTTVTVKSGDTIVIGGLIEDYSGDGVYKVPLLGDIPLIGWLFKYKTRQSEKTNLFVFITPRVIKKPEDAKAVHEDKKEYMRTLQEGTVKTTPARKREEGTEQK